MNHFKAILSRMEGRTLISDAFGPDRPGRVHLMLVACPGIEALSISSNIPSP
jgi:hypothetical protein